MNEQFILKTKQIVREWMATLSVKELVTNKKLSVTFERIEALLSKLEEHETKGLGNERYAN
ncbi:MAG: hypothetical protein KDD50_14565 [Bdellovibrionales bacterium]|nr:hypothetical protein [Bdellovibrionales bacterium]